MKSERVRLRKATDGFEHCFLFKTLLCFSFFFLLICFSKEIYCILFLCLYLVIRMMFLEGTHQPVYEVN